MRRKSSPEGLVQQVAVSYLRHGYWFYVSGWIKPGKDLEQIDRKLIDKYQIAIGERERAARKQRGLANMQYIRYRNWFLLLATEGHHPFKQHERKQIRDCRRVPIRFEGYSISYRRSGVTPKGGGPPKWHACVRIDGPTYKQLKAFFRGTGLPPFCGERCGRVRPRAVRPLCPGAEADVDHPASGERQASPDGIRPGAALSAALAATRREAV